jgi:cytochrome c
MRHSTFARALAGAGVAAALVVAPAMAKTRDDVVSIVQRAATYLQANGADKAYAEFSNPKGAFVDGELYMSVYDLKGDCLAHGADASKVGKDLSGSKDLDGKLYVQERITLAATEATFWQTYKVADPATKAPVTRTVYCQRSAAVILCSGINNA